MSECVLDCPFGNGNRVKVGVEWITHVNERLEYGGKIIEKLEKKIAAIYRLAWISAGAIGCTEIPRFISFWFGGM